jgi:anaerobic selenocysteine-containing dehydrogenase
MDDLSRREFLKRGSLTAAAAGAVLGSGATIANAVATHAEERPSEGGEQVAASEPVVAYVRRGARGEVRLLVGDDEVVRHDPELARRIIRATSR